jgi:uncharacterized protein involved in exopolysaccharide biosynthesis
MQTPESIAPYVTALRKHPRLVIGLPVAFAAVMGTVSLLKPRTFVARAAFVASESSPISGSLSAISSVATQLGVPGLSSLAGGGGSPSSSPQFYADLLTSATLMHEVVTTKYEAPADGRYEGVAFSGTIVEYFKPTGLDAIDRELSVMKSFTANNLVVATDRATGIVRIEVRTKNRILSGLVARRMLDLVNEFNLKRRQSQAGAERDFDAKRAAAALDTLRAAESALSDFRTTNIDFSHSPVLATREAQIERRITLAQQVYTTIAQRFELANVEAVRNTPVVTVLDAPEGMVQARPRYTVAFTLGAFLAGLLFAVGIAFRSERVLRMPAAPRG